MNKEELKKLQDNFSIEYAEIMNIYFQGYEWSKFHQSGSMYSFNPAVKNKFELYGIDKVIITPYITNRRFKNFPDKYVMNREKFKQLYTECLINDDLKWNYHSFTLYPSGEYESSFIWDNEAHQAQLKISFIVNLDWFFNRLNDTYIYAPDLLRKGFVMHPDGSYINSEFSNVVETGYCIIERKNSFFNMYGEVFTNDKLIFPFVYEPAGSRDQTQVSSEYIQDIFKNLYEMTDVNGELYGVYPRWNKMTIQINSSTLDFDKDVSFEWVEENA